MLIERLKQEKQTRFSGGIYDWTQYQFAYNSSRMEGSRLSLNQTKMMYETKQIKLIGNQSVPVDDFIETQNHFKCFDYIIDSYDQSLSHNYIKKLHYLLKNGVSGDQSYFAPIGKYKVWDNEVGFVQTSPVERTEEDMESLLFSYEYIRDTNLEDIIDFHVNFETIHPFADGNGRVARLLMYKECLRNDICPFVIQNDHQIDYKEALDTYRVGNHENLMQIIHFEQDIYYEKLCSLGISVEGEYYYRPCQPDEDLDI